MMRHGESSPKGLEARPKGQSLGCARLASDFGFCFQCKAGSSLVVRRSIETTALIRTFGETYAPMGVKL